LARQHTDARCFALPDQASQRSDLAAERVDRAAAAANPLDGSAVARLVRA
jgi:hypothetical protein